MPKRVNDEGLERHVLMGHGYSAVLFFDYYSVPCDVFMKEWKGLGALLPELPLFEIEVAENPSISREIGILAIPTTILFRDGTLLVSYEGPYSKAALAERLKNEMAKVR